MFLIFPNSLWSRFLFYNYTCHTDNAKKERSDRNSRKAMVSGMATTAKEKEKLGKKKRKGKKQGKGIRKEKGEEVKRRGRDPSITK